MSLNIKATIQLRLFSALKIPLIAWLRPVVEEINDDRCVIRFPLNRRTRNHLSSMYFGALSTGADCTAGLLTNQHIKRHKDPFTFVFKDFKADFLKRAEGDVTFTCRDGQKVRHMLSRAASSGERTNETILVEATVPEKFGDAPVARFELTLSLKRKG